MAGIINCSQSYFQIFQFNWHKTASKLTKLPLSDIEEYLIDSKLNEKGLVGMKNEKFSVLHTYRIDMGLHLDGHQIAIGNG